MHLKKIYITATLAILFVCCGLLYQSYNDDTRTKRVYATQITEQLHQQEEEVQTFIDNQPFIRRQILQLRGQEADKDLENLKTLEQKDFTILIFEGKDLVFWTNNKVNVSYEQDLKKQQEPIIFDQINNGYYEVIRKPLFIEGREYELAALIPLKYKYTLSSDYLVDHFTASSTK